MMTRLANKVGDAVTNLFRKKRTVQAPYAGECMHRPAMAAWDLGASAADQAKGKLELKDKARKGLPICSPLMLKMNHQLLNDDIERAQAEALRAPPEERWRFIELQRVQDLASFLWRSDVSELSKDEVCRLGRAMRAADLAGYKARMEINAPLKDEEAKVPEELASSISNVRQRAKSVAAYGYNCQVSSFL